MITLYYILLILLTVPILVMFILMAKSELYRKYLFAFIPIVLLVVFKLIYTLDVIKAHPKNELPKDYYFLSSLEMQQKWIYLWILEKDKEVPHTVVIPWTAKDSKAANEAKKAIAEGKTMAGKKKDKQTMQDDETGELLLYNFQLKDRYQK